MLMCDVRARSACDSLNRYIVTSEEPIRDSRFSAAVKFLNLGIRISDFGTRGRHGRRYN